MSVPKTQRIRDPIHNLIVFDKKDDVDMLAWRLIQTPEFQRLRRIRQLGVSEFVFPGATHTRFAHSLGVYHNARRLLNVLRELLGKKFDKDCARIAALAALLHDIGHGPFSHAFENARKTLLGENWDDDRHKHEAFSAGLITSEASQIRKELKDVDTTLPDEIAKLLRANDPASIYHAVVSSSFDADRLDYLERDRLMTGTKIGAIDLEWLIDNLDTYEISLSQEEEGPPTKVPTFIFKSKARPAAEDFLLARYRLYTTVYLHKTTRGFERLLSALMTWLGTHGNAGKLGIGSEHPLVAFLLAKEGELSDYRALNDDVVWGLIAQIARANAGYPSEIAIRLLERRRPRCLDLSTRHTDDPDFVDNVVGDIQEEFPAADEPTVFFDDVGLTLYSQIDGRESKPHKRIRVRTDKGASEITEFEDTIIGKKLCEKHKILRYYFLNDEDCARAEQIARSGG